MIEYVKGQIDELTPASAVIDCNGVGYYLNISLNTFTAIQNKKEAKLYVYEAIREDACIEEIEISFFGADSEKSREELNVHLNRLSVESGEAFV